jgi:Fe(3+) dicitrate transport protein
MILISVFVTTKNEDRFQWVDGYKIQNGRMTGTNNGTPGTDANAIVKKQLQLMCFTTTAKQLYIHPGLRLRRSKYQLIGTADLTRAGTNLTGSW